MSAGCTAISISNTSGAWLISFQGNPRRRLSRVAELTPRPNAEQIQSMESEYPMRTALATLALAFLSSAALHAATGTTVLPQHPALSKTHIVFTWAGDLWVVPRQGGEARRLTTAPGIETNAI